MMEVVPWLRYWLHALPDAHDVAAGRVDLPAADVLEAVKHFHLGAERRDDDHVFLGQAVEVVDAARFLELLDAHLAAAGR